MSGPIQSFKLPRFVADAPLLDQLTASRMNAMLDAIESGRVQPGVNTLTRWTPSGTIVSANPAATAGGITIAPFHVTVSQPSTGVYAASVYPGKVADIVPTIYGVALDVTPIVNRQRWFLQPGSSSMFLLCYITADANNSYGSNVSSSLVTDDNASPTDIDPISGEIPELKVFWDNSTTKVAGHFYIKIADIDIADTGGVTVTQWLFTSYVTFVVTGDLITVLV